jgi:hypothetical protein
MWSHYANKHNGFCLIFRSIGGLLFQSVTQKKLQIRRTTKNWIAKDMSYKMPDSFKFAEIEYHKEVKPLNAFLHMPAFVSDKGQTEKEINQIRDQQESHYRQKSKHWEYEQEFRLMLPPPMPWLFGEHFDYTKQERLFHSQSSQLVGIIYGARLNEKERLRIQEIIQERKDWELDSLKNDIIEFNFLEFEAKLSQNQRSLDIIPIGFLNHRQKSTKDTDFDRLYSEWIEGWGWKKHDRGAKKIKVE